MSNQLKSMKPQFEVYQKLEITSSQILKEKLQENVTKDQSPAQSIKKQDITFFEILEQSQEMILSQKLSSSQSLNNGEVVTSSFEDLSSKLNEYIEHYINEIKQPQKFLDSISLQNSEIIDDESSSPNSFDRNSLRQKIYQVQKHLKKQKIVDKLGLSVILSASMEQSQGDHFQVMQMMTTSTPSTPAARTEDIPMRLISSSVNYDRFSFEQCQQSQIPS